MGSRRLVLYTLTITTLLLLALSFTASAASVSRMSTDDLNSRLGAADLVVLDVRGSWDWVDAKGKIAGSVRVEPGSVNQWAGDYDREKIIVLYCT